MSIGKLKKLMALGPASLIMLTEIWFKLLLAKASFTCLSESTATRIWFVKKPVLAVKEALTINVKKTAEIDRIVKLLQIAVSHHIVSFTCLHRVLILKNIMDKKAITASIVIGVKKDKNRLSAHAWVQVGDRVVADQKSYTDQFKPLDNQGAVNFALINEQDSN